MNAVLDVAVEHGVSATCNAFGMPRATFYRQRAPMLGPKPRRASPPRRLRDTERAAVLGALHEPRFADLAPAEVHATLLEEGRYLCSVRTMHRVLAQNAEMRERRNQLRHPNYAPPQLLATRPNELWSWDRTKLLGPTKWSYFYLYIILDVFSRYVVGWMVARCESAALAHKLIAETCATEAVTTGQLTLHADRGASRNPSPLRCCYLTSVSPRRILVRTFRTTIRSASLTSRPSSTGQVFLSASVSSKMPAASARISSPGTTMNITTAALRC